MACLWHAWRIGILPSAYRLNTRHVWRVGSRMSAYRLSNISIEQASLQHVLGCFLQGFPGPFHALR